MPSYVWLIIVPPFQGQHVPVPGQDNGLPPALNRTFVSDHQMADRDLVPVCWKTRRWCKRRCKSDPGRRMRSDPPDTLGVSRWEAPDADRGRGRGDPSAAPARNEHPRDCENDWDIAQRGSALSAHTGSAALQKAGAEAIKTRSI